MASKHTPGPWTWRNGGNHYVLEDAKGEVVADDGSAYGEYSGWFQGEPSADAVLIAAAPDLLAALQDILPTVERMLAARWEPAGIEAPERRSIEAARAAIAKATGAQQ